MLLHRIIKYLRAHSTKKHRTGITVCWPVVSSPRIEEETYCLQFCRTFSHKNCLKADSHVKWMDCHLELELGRLLPQVATKKVLLVTNPKLLITGSVLHRMASVLDIGYAACGPVYNLTDYTGQKAELPASYLNIRSYLEIIGLMQDCQEPDFRPAEELDPGCVLCDRAFLKRMDPEVQLGKLEIRSENRSRDIFAVEPGSLVHNFGIYSAWERDDLTRLVPQGCRRILDVGCGAGLFAQKLRQNISNVEIIGVEINPDIAELAKAHYDQVLTQPVQDVGFNTHFDLINCGDVLEHLEDPWAVLKKLCTLLNDQGYLVLSVPNAGHWTVVQDLLQGQFAYVPWGILCITHLRWFTEESIRQALDQAGFEIELFERQQVDPTPQGREFVRTMVEQGWGNEESLLSNEFLIRAYKR